MSEAKEVKVSFTAKVMATARAIETQRPDSLFSDFFAKQLVDADVMHIRNSLAGRGLKTTFFNSDSIF
jgi:O-methyltransferase involved in polyketide biosynthesis